MAHHESNSFVTALGNSLAEIYKFHGLNEAVRILYNSIKDLLPIHTIACVAKPSRALWLVRLASFSEENSEKPQINTFDSILASDDTKRLLEDKENTTVLFSKDKDPHFFRVLTHDLEHAMGTCLLMTDRNIIYLHLYAKLGAIFTQENAAFLSRLLAPLSEALRNTFIFPAPFTGLSSRHSMESAVSLLQICPDMKDVENQVRQISGTDSLVLITGESGVGKDLIAKAIHETSSRKSKPFVKVNCGAIPETLLDSELFGYEKGAFTGANHAKAGYFEQAEGGTIFLDEVGELSLGAQVRLLHVLENGQIQRVGSMESQKVNTRVIAATNKELWAEAARGDFREDLCYRLFVCHVEVPPLRERKSDIPVLIWYFLNKKAEKMNLPPKLQVLEEEIRKMCEYAWPGNVRELEHTIERSLIYSGDSPLLKLKMHTYNKRQPTRQDSAWQDFDSYVGDYLRRALEHTGGRIKGPKGAARLLGMNASTLRSRCLKYGLLDSGSSAK